jgi:hypothetical protein
MSSYGMRRGPQGDMGDKDGDLVFSWSIWIFEVFEYRNIWVSMFWGFSKRD